MPLVLSPWLSASRLPKPDPQVAHLWRFRLDDLHADVSFLSPAERARADRLLDPGKAAFWRIARIRLRQILASYLDVSAERVPIDMDEFGKPFIAHPDPGLAFNLSHSEAWGVCLVSCLGPVGVDIEQIDPYLDIASVAARYFSTNEKERLYSRPETCRRREFFRIWTRKEAWLKGRGRGFAGAGTNLPIKLLLPGRGGADVWQVRNFVIDRSCLGAVAVPRATTFVQRTTWLPG